ncbi:MAG TPA: hypothetical protein VK727_20250 [Steroidobacteraceae bacterium]|jgi:hypothetical protein|nr:hypothetical protein [Steroidobacteraceae bacterium]
MKLTASGIVVLGAAAVLGQSVRAADCNKACLEGIAAAYRAAYLKHDVSLAPFAPHVRYSENNAEMTFPDGTWDTVTQEVDTPLVLSDPATGQIGIYTTVLQRQTQGFLAVRLRVRNRHITEVEHVIATKRNVSAPPVPMGDALQYHRDPALQAMVPEAQRLSRAQIRQLADGYFSTLQYNTGEIRGTRFAAAAVRHENGMPYTDLEKGFKSGRYRYNNRVRDRDCFLVDEERGFTMCRGFIDHKGVLDAYTMTDGTAAKSNYQEPQSWGFLESFKVNKDGIVAVEATFSAVPYYLRSPWTKKPDPTYDASKSPVTRAGVPASGPASQ